MAERWVIRQYRRDGTMTVRPEDVRDLVAAAGEWMHTSRANKDDDQDHLMAVIQAMQTLGIMVLSGEGASDG